MTPTIETVEADALQLTVAERAVLVERLIASLEADPEVEEAWTAEAQHLPLTEAQRQELERRLADYEAHPDDVVSWDEVRAQALERARR